MSVTIRDIALEAGVSPSTVSRVINLSVPVSEEIRERVFQAMGKLKYNKAPSKSKNQEPNIGIIISKESAANMSIHPPILAIVTSFIEVLSSHQINNTIIVLDNKIPAPEKLFSSILNGYLVIGTSEQQEDTILPFLECTRVPFLLVNRWLENKRFSYVNIDDTDASVSAVSHLITLGHKRIAFAGGDKDFRNTKLRLSGYQIAMNNVNLPTPENYTFFGEYTEEYGGQLGRELLELEDRPTAIFIASDAIAIGCQRYLLERGLSLPQDMAMVGFGNIEACAYVRPTLSTISQPSKEMGIAAATALIQLIEMPSIINKHILMDAKLIIRESSGNPVL